MRRFKMIILSLSFLLLSGRGVSVFAEGSKTENKNITLISAQNTADGKSKVWKELLEECIVSLPKAADLAPAVTSQANFLKGINGDKNNNEHVKTYRASLEINYMLHQKELIIVATSSIQGQPPVMKEVVKKIKKSESFNSNPSEGDIYAGRSDRQYYYSTENGAVDDVKKRAEIWLKQQSAVLCSDN